MLVLKYLNLSTAGSNTKSSKFILFEYTVTVEPSVGKTPLPCGPENNWYCEIANDDEVLPNSTKLDSIGEFVVPSVQLNSLCINCPASNGSVTQILYTFNASDLGQLTLICIVSFWSESELTTIVTS